MKTKFLLTLLTLNGIFWGMNSATATIAATTASSEDLASLSQTISSSLNLDPATHSLIEFAIDRASIAQSISGSSTPIPIPSITAGVPKSTSDTASKPIVLTGRTGKPNPQKIGQQKIGKIAKPSDLPQPKPSANKKS